MIAAAGYLWHPLSPTGAAFYGGIGSDLGEITMLGVIAGWLRHHNCHVHGCWRLGHLDPLHNHPACRNHHSKAHLLNRR